MPYAPSGSNRKRRRRRRTRRRRRRRRREVKEVPTTAILDTFLQTKISAPHTKSNPDSPVARFAAC
jgi:hypothetical protein